MSYINLPQINFAGSFSAKPGTINNVAVNYYAYQSPDPFMQGDSSQSPNSFSNPDNFPPEVQRYLYGPSWYPTGVATFKFNCTVASFLGSDGSPLAGLEGATFKTMVLPGSSTGKLVDLDTNQQTLTQLYGIVVKLALSDGTKVFTAKMSLGAQEANQLPVLNDLWFAKDPDATSDAGASGIFQWILDDIVWEDTSSMPSAVVALQESYAQGISIKINTDRYNGNSTSNGEYDAYSGRIVGSIGPVQSGEPFSFLLGRRFLPSSDSQYWVGSFVLGADNKLTLDLGNSIPVDQNGTPLNLNRQLVAGTMEGSTLQPFTNGQDIPVTRDHYETFAGIVSFQIYVVGYI
ncbi:MAG: hypothetical protein F6K41_27835 [Symploca sp. SIO3E6]|nr:hypothetical protein [Caldora sp. SIO3E6]